MKLEDFVLEMYIASRPRIINEGAPAAQQAKSQGLRSIGFGRWVNSYGDWVASTVHGQLVFHDNSSFDRNPKFSEAHVKHQSRYEKNPDQFAEKQHHSDIYDSSVDPVDDIGSMQYISEKERKRRRITHLKVRQMHFEPRFLAKRGADILSKLSNTPVSAKDIPENAWKVLADISNQFDRISLDSRGKHHQPGTEEAHQAFDTLMKGISVGLKQGKDTRTSVANVIRRYKDRNPNYKYVDPTNRLPNDPEEERSLDDMSMFGKKYNDGHEPFKVPKSEVDLAPEKVDATAKKKNKFKGKKLSPRQRKAKNKYNPQYKNTD